MDRLQRTHVSPTAEWSMTKGQSFLDHFWLVRPLWKIPIPTNAYVWWVELITKWDSRGIVLLREPLVLIKLSSYLFILLWNYKNKIARREKKSFADKGSVYVINMRQVTFHSGYIYNEPSQTTDKQHLEIRQNWFLDASKSSRWGEGGGEQTQMEKKSLPAPVEYQ